MILTPTCGSHPLQHGESRVAHAMLAGVERDMVLAYSIDGMHSLLGALNARTRFRVTALCPLEPGPLAHISVYDRDQPRGRVEGSLHEVCAIARVIADDFDATRISTDALVSRAGALVYTTTGDVWGVLLHYDLRLRIAPPKERMVLAHLGRKLSTLFPREFGAVS